MYANNTNHTYINNFRTKLSNITQLNYKKIDFFSQTVMTDMTRTYVGREPIFQNIFINIK